MELIEIRIQVRNRRLDRVGPLGGVRMFDAHGDPIVAVVHLPAYVEVRLDDLVASQLLVYVDPLAKIALPPAQERIGAFQRGGGLNFPPGPLGIDQHHGLFAAKAIELDPLGFQFRHFRIVGNFANARRQGPKNFTVVAHYLFFPLSVGSFLTLSPRSLRLGVKYATENC